MKGALAFIEDSMDILEANEYQGELLTCDKLAERLSCEPLTENSSETEIVKFLNECLKVVSNPNVKALSKEERLRTIKSAFCAYHQLTGR